MATIITCDNCGKRYRIRDPQSLTSIRCRACDTTIPVAPEAKDADALEVTRHLFGSSATWITLGMVAMSGNILITLVPLFFLRRVPFATIIIVAVTLFLAGVTLAFLGAFARRARSFARTGAPLALADAARAQSRYWQFVGCLSTVGCALLMALQGLASLSR